MPLVTPSPPTDKQRRHCGQWLRAGKGCPLQLLMLVQTHLTEQLTRSVNLPWYLGSVWQTDWQRKRRALSFRLYLSSVQYSTQPHAVHYRQLHTYHVCTYIRMYTRSQPCNMYCVYLAYWLCLTCRSSHNISRTRWLSSYLVPGECWPVLISVIRY